MKRPVFLSAAIAAVAVAMSTPSVYAGGFHCRGGSCGPVVISSCDSYCGYPIIPCGPIFPDPVFPTPDDPVFPDPDDPKEPVFPKPEGTAATDIQQIRTWVYGSSPKLVFGGYRGVEGSHVKLQQRNGRIVSIPIHQLSAGDQRLVVRQIGGQQRTWTDSTDQYTRRAKFSGTERGMVVLKASDGKRITVPFARLSESDRAVVRLLAPSVLDYDLPAPSKAQLARR